MVCCYFSFRNLPEYSLKHTFISCFASELQKDEAEHVAMGENKDSFVTVSKREVEISMSHPYYDVARHNIIHFIGTFVKINGPLFCVCHSLYSPDSRYYFMQWFGI